MTFKDSITKQCTWCKVEKSIDLFSRDKNRKDGRHPHCKPCTKEKLRQHYQNSKEQYSVYAKAYYLENKDAYLERATGWAKKNKEKRKEISKKYVENNPEKRAETSRNNRLSNPGMYAAHYKMRQTRKRKAMPSWACEDSIKAIYRQCAFVTRMTGIKHHVDHFYPLTSDLVCGLHNQFNLRIIPAVENLSKGNKLPIGANHDS